MGSLIMWNIVTVDGYFEGNKSWDLPWHDLVWSEDLERFSIEQLTSADALLFGRTTYEGMATYWSTAVGTIAEHMNSIQKFVVSTSLETAGWNNTRLIHSDLENAILGLKRLFSKDIYIFGSAMLLQQLVRAGLIDEYRIGIAPHIHGSGSLLFQPGLPEQDLRLVGVQTVKNDGLIVTYQPKRT